MLLAGAFVIYTNLDPRPFAWLTAVGGLILLQGANSILSFGLTRDPRVSASIWASAGLAGVLMLPAMYVDHDSQARKYLLYLITVLVAIMAGLALVMAFEAHYGHIAEVVSG